MAKTAREQYLEQRKKERAAADKARIQQNRYNNSKQGIYDNISAKLKDYDNEVRKYGDIYNSTFFDSNGKAKKGYLGNVGEQGKAATFQAANIVTKRRAVQDAVAKWSDYLDDDYKASIEKYFNDSNDELTKLNKDFQDSYNYYSRFIDEADYKTQLADAERYKSEEGARNKIAALEAEKAKIEKWLKNPTYNGVAEEYLKQETAPGARERAIKASQDRVKQGYQLARDDIDQQIYELKKQYFPGEIRTWFNTGAFDDGYQFGDLGKSVYATTQDIKSNIAGGLLDLGEGIIDTGAYVANAIARLTGTNDLGDVADILHAIARVTHTDKIAPINSFLSTLDGMDLRDQKVQDYIVDFIKKDLYNGADVARAVIDPFKLAPEEDSFLGEKSRGLLQSGGQLAGTTAITALSGGTIPWWVTMGASTFGGEAEQALNQGATFAQAGASGLISAGAEILSEKLSGGISFGGGTLDDLFLDPLLDQISNKAVKALAKTGADALGEGFEEIFSGVISNLGTALYREENLEDILLSEEALNEYIEGFIGGAVLGGGMGGVRAATDAARSAYDTYKAGMAINDAEGATNRLVDLGRTIPETAKLSEKVASKPSAYKTGRLYERVRDSVTPENEEGAQRLAEIEESVYKAVPTSSVVSEAAADRINTAFTEEIDKTTLPESVKAAVTRDFKLPEDIDPNSAEAEQYAREIAKDAATAYEAGYIQERDGKKLKDGQLEELTSVATPDQLKYYSDLGRERALSEAVEGDTRTYTADTPKRIEARKAFLSRSADEVRAATKADKTLTAKQREAVEYGEKLGVAVGFADLSKYYPSRRNGVSLKKKGVVIIDTNTASPLQQVYIHELSHISETAKGYAKLKKTVLNSKLLDKWLTEQGFTGSLANKISAYRVEKKVDYAEHGVNLTIEGAEAELIANFLGETIGTEERFNTFMNELTSEQKRTFLEWLKDIITRIKDAFSGSIPSELREIERLYKKALTEAGENAKTKLTAKQEIALHKNGIGVDAENGVAWSIAYSPASIADVKQREAKIEEMAQFIHNVTGRSIEDCRKWVKAETSISAEIMQDPDMMAVATYEADERYQAIKQNSDYPQGTVDLSNLCPKRSVFTWMISRLQEKYPDRLFDAVQLAEMRGILEKADIQVACALCFVEDRRQKVGEIAEIYKNMWKDAVESGRPLTKTNANGERKPMKITKRVAEIYGVESGKYLYATDTYIPNQYDLTTYEGFKKLQVVHPQVAMGFEMYNNSRGQQAARLIEGRAEYKRQILDWSDKKVKQVNDAGGLRIFSFSDFEVAHLVDIIQIIIDCSAKGVKIQGYTKIPAFAKLVRNTGIKLNRSLIPKGKGIKIVNGKKVLDYDFIEGMNMNDKNFLDEEDSADVGNVLVGINAEQIALAMVDPFIDYIIPFHTNKSKAVCQALGLESWKNYKDSQHDKNNRTGKAAKKNINIYTEVLDVYHPKNKVEFVEAFLEVAKKKNYTPRFAEFLNTDANGNYVYTEGYHKFLVDFKLFDKQGNILPQGLVTPDLDATFMRELISSEVEKNKDFSQYEDVFAELDSEYGEQFDISEAVLELPKSNELSKLVNDLHGAAKYKVIQKYIFDLLGGQTITLSDGRNAIVDNRDAAHIASKAGNQKTAFIFKIKEIIKKAELFAEEKNVDHNKFSDFYYYKSVIKYENDTFPIYLNVGKGKNDGALHIYDITQKLRDSANRTNGFERPTPNEGYALKNAISNSSVSHSDENVKGQFSIPEKSSDGQKLTDAQRRYFRNSKVRDEKGRLLAVYHGTKRAGFTTFTKTDEIGYFFARSMSTSRTYANKSKAIYAPDRYNSEAPSSDANYKVFLNISNPYVVDGKGAQWNDVTNAGDKVLMDFKIKDWDSNTYTGKGWAKLKYKGKVYRQYFTNPDQLDRFINQHLNEKVANSIAYALNCKVEEDGKGNAQLTGTLPWDFLRSQEAKTKSTRDIVREASTGRYDGVVFKNVVDSGDGSKIKADDLYVAFYSNQIKSVNNLDPTYDNDIRYDIPEDRSVEPVEEETYGDSIPERARRLEQRFADGEIEYDELVRAEAELMNEARQKYGVIEEGENAEVEAKVPTAVENNKVNSKYVRTILETGAVSDALARQLGAKTLLGDFSHTPISDKDAIAEADKAIKQHTAENKWGKTVESIHSVPSKYDLAIGEQLLANALKEGKTTKAIEIASDLVDVYTRAGQALQSARLLKKLTGVGRLVQLQRTVNQINRDLKKRSKKHPAIKIGESLAEEMANANTPDEVDAIANEIEQDLANQMKVTLLDIANAWRYLCMLANPITHIRNFVGNMIFAPSIQTRRALQYVMEKALPAEQRTVSYKIDDKYRKFAEKMVSDKTVRSVLDGTDKYSAKTKAMMKRKVLPKLLQTIYEKNSELLGGEDMWYKTRYYKYTLASYLQARQIDLDKITEAELTEASEYAISEAKKNTYADDSTLARLLNKLKSTSAIGYLAVEGIVPFRKTPINIIKRGLEYSPLGLVNALTSGTAKLKKGDITASEYIYGLSAGGSGAIAFIMGMFLKAIGAASGGFGDDDESKYRKLLGEQEYAFIIGDRSYSIDWAAPINIPFFMGVELMKQLETQKEDIKFAEALSQSSFAVLDPIINLSMLSGLQRTFQAFRYGEGTAAFGAIAESMVTNYASQFVPAVGGKVTSLFSEDRKSNYVDKNSQLPSFVQSILNSMMSKSVFFDKRNPYIDAWGRTVSQGNVVERFLENFVSPGYFNKTDYTVVDVALLELYEATGETSMFPDSAPKYFAVDGKRKDLTADEYVKYATAKGQYSFAYLKEFFDSDYSKELSPEEQIKTIEKIYKYANDKAKAVVSNYDVEEKNKTVFKEEEDGGSVPAYFANTVKSERYAPSLYNEAIAQGNTEEAERLKADIISWKQENGKTEREAESELKQSISSYWKDKYIDAYIAGDSAEMQRIQSVLKGTGYFPNPKATVRDWYADYQAKQREEARKKTQK